MGLSGKILRPQANTLIFNHEQQCCRFHFRSTTTAHAINMSRNMSHAICRDTHFLKCDRTLDFFLILGSPMSESTSPLASGASLSFPRAGLPGGVGVFDLLDMSELLLEKRFMKLLCLCHLSRFPFSSPFLSSASSWTTEAVKIEIKNECAAMS